MTPPVEPQGTSAPFEHFHVGDVLSVTTGVLVGPSHVDGIYKVVDFMEQRPHWTHELPDAAERVKVSILVQVPELAEAYPPEWDQDGDVKAQCEQWVERVCEHIGRTEITLHPCADEHIEALPAVDPIQTLRDKIGRP